MTKEAGISVGEEVAVERVPLMAWLSRGVARNVEDLAIEELASTSQVMEELILEALVRRAGIR